MPCAPNRARFAALLAAALLVPPAQGAPDPLAAQARRYVELALSLERFDPHAVDAYFGPPMKPAPTPSLTALESEARKLAAQLRRDPPSPRRDRLVAKLNSLAVLTQVMQHPPSFEEEARRLYGVAVPSPDPRALVRSRAALEKLLPGRGDLGTRLAAWRARFAIPEAQRNAVFLRALAECRTRTIAHWPLPTDEKLDVTWSSDVPAAWHRYRGHDRSRLEINPDAVADPGQVLDVACHEGYPGHHAQFLLQHPAAPEDSVVILRSPEQVLREGAANVGVALAFPPAARLAFTREVLFPLAGFDPRDAQRFVHIHRLAGELALSVLPILRDYRDGKLASGDAMAALMLQGAIASPQALMQYTRDTGAYVIGYTAARDLVRDCVAARGGPSPEKQWAALNAIVAAPGPTALPCKAP